MKDPGYFFSEISWPLLRLLIGLSAGLVLAIILETLSWTKYLAKAAAPLAKAAHFGSCARTSFALAFVSPAAANALLAEKYDCGSISLLELVLANLFNGLPAWLLHIPTIFFLSWPVLGFSAFIYAGLTFSAAMFRTISIAFIGRHFLPYPEEKTHDFAESNKKTNFSAAVKTALGRFKKSFIRLICYTVPVYIIIAYVQNAGLFYSLQLWLTRNFEWLALLKPQAISIVILQILAETGSALGAAAVVLETGALSDKDVIIAMLIGTVLAAPIRSIRHQLPVYAGYYKIGIAVKLIIANQLTRAFAIIIIILLYAGYG